MKKLNQLTKQHFRLLTEAEWEFAARGGNKSRGYKHAGSDTLSTVAWFTDNSNNQTHEVGTKSPNELGLYDMNGNVWEWCQDRYGVYNAAAQNNPTGASSGSDRVYRGGSCDYYGWCCRLSDRYFTDPGNRGRSLGFRLAL